MKIINVCTDFTNCYGNYFYSTVANEKSTPIISLTWTRRYSGLLQFSSTSPQFVHVVKKALTNFGQCFDWLLPALCFEITTFVEYMFAVLLVSATQSTLFLRVLILLVSFLKWHTALCRLNVMALWLGLRWLRVLTNIYRPAMSSKIKLSFFALSALRTVKSIPLLLFSSLPGDVLRSALELLKWSWI